MPDIQFFLLEGEQPCIALNFESEALACQTHRDIILNHRKERFQLTVFLIRDFMNLLLIGKDKEWLYKNINYNYHQFTWWYFYAKYSEDFNFVQCYGQGKDVELAVVGLNKDKFLLNIVRVHLIDADLQLFGS